MKKRLLILICFFTIIHTKAQVAFCPPGAEWHYNFAGFMSNYFANEEIKYVKDSIVGSDTLKILSHSRYYIRCNPLAMHFTHIRQNADTVFFRNAMTQNTWQILYNFACQPGQSWQTTYLRLANNSQTLSPVTTTFMVNSVSTITVNNLALKSLNMGTFTITERIGSDKFLFMLENSTYCHTDNFARMLCYQDSTFGLYDFIGLGCNYSGSWSAVTGINENNPVNVNIYPNPVMDELTIETDPAENMLISFTTVHGQEVKRTKAPKNFKIDISNLNKGLYLLTILKDNEIVFKTKLIKE